MNATLPPPPLLAAVTCVCATQPAVQSLSHVAQAIDAFLDESCGVGVAQAVARSSLRLLHRVVFSLTRDAAVDPFLRELWIRRGFELAVKRGDMAMVRMLHATHRTFLSANALELAAARGDLELLQWLHEHRPSERDCLPSALAAAAANGHLDILSWIFEKIISNQVVALVCPSSALRRAIVNGHVDTAEYLVSNGVRAKMNAAGDEVAANGHLAMVKWLHERNFAFVFTTEAMTAAAREGHLKIVRYLHENRSEGCRSRAIDGAATIGRLDIVKFLFYHRTEGCTARAVNGAAQNGHLSTLQWLLEHIPSDRTVWTSQAATNALAFGQYEVLEWLLSHSPDRYVCRHKFPPYAALEVAKEGNRRGLQMLHEIHGPAVRWSPRVMDVAAASGDLEMVQWLYDNRPNENWQTALDRAAENDHLHVIQFMHCRGALASSWAMNKAAAGGHLDVVKWLHEHRAEGCTVDAMNMAAEAGHLAVVKWLHEHRNEGCTTDAMDSAAIAGHLEVVIWLHGNRHEGYTVNANAAHDQWEVIRWLAQNRREGCSIRNADDAAAHGQLRILDLFQSEFRVHATWEGIQRAAAGGHLNVVQWAFEQQFGEPDAVLFNRDQCRAQAESHGHFHITDWLDRQS